MTTFQATSKAAEAPNIEEGRYDLRFEGTQSKMVKTGKYVKDPVNGDPKLQWDFVPLDDDGSVIYDNGDPIELGILTGVGFNTASKTVPLEVKLLKALLTKEEFQTFLDGGGVKEEDIRGRIVSGEVFIKESGWPGVTDIVAKRTRRGAAAQDA